MNKEKGIMILKLQEKINKHSEELIKIFDEKMETLNDEEMEDLGFIANKEILVINPFYDETYLRQVQPIEHYGKEFINSKLAEYILNY